MISLFQAQVQRAANRRAASGAGRAVSGSRNADSGSRNADSGVAGVERAIRGAGRAMRGAVTQRALQAALPATSTAALPSTASPHVRKPAVPPGASMAYNAPFAHQAAVQAVAPAGAAMTAMAAMTTMTTKAPPAPLAQRGAARDLPIEAALCAQCRAALGEACAGTTNEASSASAHAPLHAPAPAPAHTSALTPASATPVSSSAPAHPATGPAALQRAIEVCGGQAALASAIGLTQAYVWNWLHRRSVPAEHCPAIERATRRAVRCEALRPDVDWGYLRALCEDTHDHHNDHQDQAAAGA